MSRSVIACRDCKLPVAYRHHSGRIRVADNVRAVYLPDGSLELTCSCGDRKVIKPETKAA